MLAVSHYFNAPEEWDCGKMGSDPCGACLGSCGDTNERGNVDNPAGWMILQSTTTFHDVSRPAKFHLVQRLQIILKPRVADLAGRRVRQ